MWWSAGSHHTKPPPSQIGCSPKKFSFNHPCCSMVSVAFKNVPPTSSNDLCLPFCINYSSMTRLYSPWSGSRSGAGPGRGGLSAMARTRFYSIWHSYTHHGLEAGVELDEEGGLECHGQDPLLHHRAVHIVVLVMAISTILKIKKTRTKNGEHDCKQKLRLVRTTL